MIVRPPAQLDVPLESKAERLNGSNSLDHDVGFGCAKEKMALPFTLSRS